VGERLLRHKRGEERAVSRALREKKRGCVRGDWEREGLHCDREVRLHEILAYDNNQKKKVSLTKGKGRSGRHVPSEAGQFKEKEQSRLGSFEKMDGRPPDRQERGKEKDMCEGG